jgi:hypothetical protein
LGNFSEHLAATMTALEKHRYAIIQKSIADPALGVRKFASADRFIAGMAS